MLNIYWGRESVDKERFLVENLGSKAIVIVPDQFTLEAERAIIELLGAKALMEIEVLSMSRLGHRLISELGGGKRTFIDKYGRHMLLAGIAAEERENLQVFRGLESKNSFIELVNNFISELKQYGFDSHELDNVIKEVEPDSYVYKKLQDLKLLYGSYEHAIEGKYTDSEDYIDLFINKIEKSEFVKGRSVWIYGFDSFAPKAVAVIGELMSHAPDVNVIMTACDDQESRDYELFELSRRVIEKLSDTAKARGVKAAVKQIPQDYSINDKKAAIKHIEREIYALPSKAADDDQKDGITLLAAANFYNEAESAAAFVLDLVRGKGLRYNEIKIVCNDLEERGSILKRIFREYGMELFSDSGKDILQNPVIRYVLATIDVIVEKFRNEAIFRVLKSGMLEMSAVEIADLENYTIKYKIRGSMWKRHFTRGEREYGVEGLGYLEALRERAMQPLLKFEESIKVKTNLEFIEALYEYLYKEVCLPDKIFDFMEAQIAGGHHELAEETAQIWKSLVGILEQMAEICGEEKFEIRKFSELLRIGISQIEIGVLPPTVDGLVMGTMQRSRSSKIKALVVVGANEGVLPRESSSAGLFGSEEKELFSSRGVEICKVDSVRVLEERMGIYRNFSKPSEYLYVSVSNADIDGNTLRPSSVFNKLKEIFPTAAVEKDILNRDDVKDLINGSMSGLRHLTGALQDVAEGKAVSDDWKAMISWLQLNREDEIAKIKKGISFTNRQEKLGAEVAEKLFKKNVSEDYSLSPSRIERYSRCPFSHLISYGLKPEERRVFEIAPREIGDIYHQCLMELTESLTEEGVPVTSPKSKWMTITEEECHTMVEAIIRKEADNYRDGLFKLGNEENYRSGRIIDICKKVCWVVIEQVRCGAVESCGFEVSFGRDGKIAPLVIEPDGRKIYIEGKIDRVDFLSGNRVKIIDYKTGNETFSIKEAELGYRLQLMVYLEAAIEKERKPAGVFYMNISEPMIDMSAKNIDYDDLADSIRKNFKLNGIMVDDEQVIQNVAGDFRGYSQIVPIFKNKDGVVSPSGKEGLLSDEEFFELRETVCDKIEDICRNLVNGNIDIHPMKTQERSACTYCEFKGICRFDTAFDGCSYNLI